jgi:MoaA/NifB/PqqE/SkfB family radical SAM enzyme
VCDYIEKHYDKIKEVALIGGEPLLLPENERLLEVIPPDCIVTLITNLSNNLENNAIFQKLTQRQRVGWSISFDNIGERFEYVRYGAKWETFLHNLDLVQDLMKHNGHWGGIHAVYNLYNATRLCEFKSFAQERGLTIRWQNLATPPALDPRRHGREIAQLAAAEIQRVYDQFDVDQSEQDLFDSAFATYLAKEQADSESLEMLALFVNKIEGHDHPDTQGDFARLWPEYGALWQQNQS